MGLTKRCQRSLEESQSRGAEVERLQKALEEKSGSYVYSVEIELKQYLKALALQHNFYLFVIVLRCSKTSLKVSMVS